MPLTLPQLERHLFKAADILGAAHAAGFEPLRVELDRGREATGGVWYPSPSTPSPARLGPFSVSLALRG